MPEVIDVEEYLDFETSATDSGLSTPAVRSTLEESTRVSTGGGMKLPAPQIPRPQAFMTKESVKTFYDCVKETAISHELELPFLCSFVVENTLWSKTPPVLSCDDSEYYESQFKLDADRRTAVECKWLQMLQGVLDVCALDHELFRLTSQAWMTGSFNWGKYDEWVESQCDQFYSTLQYALILFGKMIGIESPDMCDYTSLGTVFAINNIYEKGNQPLNQRGSTSNRSCRDSDSGKYVLKKFSYVQGQYNPHDRLPSYWNGYQDTVVHFDETMELIESQLDNYTGQRVVDTMIFLIDYRTEQLHKTRNISSEFAKRCTRGMSEAERFMVLKGLLMERFGEALQRLAYLLY